MFCMLFIVGSDAAGTLRVALSALPRIELIDTSRLSATFERSDFFCQQSSPYPEVFKKLVAAKTVAAQTVALQLQCYAHMLMEPCSCDDHQTLNLALRPR
jgi:hypothetical protein